MQITDSAKKSLKNALRIFYKKKVIFFVNLKFKIYNFLDFLYFYKSWIL